MDYRKGIMTSYNDIYKQHIHALWLTFKNATITLTKKREFLIKMKYIVIVWASLNVGIFYFIGERASWPSTSYDRNIIMRSVTSHTHILIVESKCRDNLTAWACERCFTIALKYHISQVVRCCRE